MQSTVTEKKADKASAVSPQLSPGAKGKSMPAVPVLQNKEAHDAGKLQEDVFSQTLPVQGKFEMQAAPTTNQTAQLVAWPTGRRAVKPDGAGTLWEGEDESDIKALYEFCGSVEQFDKIIKAKSRGDWDGIKGLINSAAKKTEFLDGIDAAGADADVVSFFTYFKARYAVARVLQVYDAGTYAFPGTKATELMNAKGIVPADYARAGLRAGVGAVEIADRAYSKQAWEKQANNAVLTAQERIDKNTLVGDALAALTLAVNTLHADKTALDAEEAAAAAYAANVAAMDANARALPAFAGVAGNALALKVWQCSVSNAGKTGYLQVDNTIYTKATVTAATTALHTFSTAYRAAYADGTQYLSNPHTPGGGQPQDKQGHSNFDLRASRYQANFIGTWGGKDTVVHINSDTL